MQEMMNIGSDLSSYLFIYLFSFGMSSSKAIQDWILVSFILSGCPSYCGEADMHEPL